MAAVEGGMPGEGDQRRRNLITQYIFNRPVFFYFPESFPMIERKREEERQEEKEREKIGFDRSSPFQFGFSSIIK